MERNPSHAGSWYSNDRDELDQQLTQWLQTASVEVPVQSARAIIAPHAGYTYSGRAAGYAYACLDTSHAERVFILGPSHHVYLDGCAVSTCTTYKTPLGDLQVDTATIKSLEATGHFTPMSKRVDEDEHSIEMQLPYIHKVLGHKARTVKVVPIMVGSISVERERFYGELLAPYLADPSNLFVISSDFCHWGKRFRYCFYSDATPPSARCQTLDHSHAKLTIPIHRSIERLDKEAMGILEQLDLRLFSDYLRKTKNTICGRHPIGVLLAAIDQVKLPCKLEFTRYEQSSAVLRVDQSSVSYASASIQF